MNSIRSSIRNRFCPPSVKVICHATLCFLTLYTSLSTGLTLTRIVQLHSGRVQGILVSPKMVPPVEMYLGVPYATPPLGINRFSPTRSVPPWSGVRVCDQFAPVCPQKVPNTTAAHLRMSRGRLASVHRVLPYLRKWSEDCLYLNVYAPTLVGDAVRPVMVFIHGSDDFSTGGANSFDARLLAAYTNLVVVTVNYRLGALGFLNLNTHPGSRPRVANSGLMDQIAALQWVQQNIRQFGGDPRTVTLVGHGTGAACVHFLAVSPVLVSGLFRRIILLSGSAFSSWALVNDPVEYAASLARQLNCTDLPDVMGCMQTVAVEDILNADIRSPEFLNSFGPSVDGVVIRPEYDMAENVREVDVLFGVVTGESLGRFSNADLDAGFDGSRRDRILRTYVRNAYAFHLPEIFVTVVNEYTDWERTVVHPINTRDATIAALSDAQYVAPLVKTGDYFSARPRGKSKSSTYFYVFSHHTKYGDFPPRLGTAHGDDLAYLFGAPLVPSLGHFPRNFTRAEVALSEAFMISVANFIKTGDPNMEQNQSQFLSISKEKNRFTSVLWDQYDPVHQKYMDISVRPRLKNHFRSHQLSIWLQLIPELHKAGMGDAHTRHNRFFNHHSDDLYAGLVLPDPISPSRDNATVAEVVLAIATTDTMVTTCATFYSTRIHRNGSLEQHEAYTSMLNLTVAIGIGLLVLNLLIFGAIYYQREKTRLEMKRLDREKRLREDRGLKHSTSVILDMDNESPMMVLTHLPPENGSANSGVGHFMRKSRDLSYHHILTPPSPPQLPSKAHDIPTAAMSEITV